MLTRVFISYLNMTWQVVIPDAQRFYILQYYLNMHLKACDWSSEAIRMGLIFNINTSSVYVTSCPIQSQIMYNG